MKTFFTVTILSFNKDTYSDFFSCDDLFTYVAYNDQKRRTTTKWNKSLPEWNEDLIFNFSQDCKSIKIAIMDEDRWKPSEKVWERTVPIEQKNIGKVIEIDSLSLIYDICIMSSYKQELDNKKENLDKLKIIQTQLENVIDEKQSQIQDIELDNIEIHQSGLISQEEEKLPEDWESARDDEGDVYYHNKLSGVSQWEKPKKCNDNTHCYL